MAAVAFLVFGVAIVLRGSPSRAQPAPVTAAAARALYLRDCAVCHGNDARGTNRGPTLVGVGRASIDYYVSTGRMPLVPAGRTSAPDRPQRPLPDAYAGDPAQQPTRHAPAYGPAEVTALVDYTAALAGGGPDVPALDLRHADLADGGRLFRLMCAACHSWSGEGGALLHVNAPPTHPATNRQIADAVRAGPGQMPAFGTSAITDHQLSDVVAYVRSLRSPRDRGGFSLWHIGPVAEGGVAWIVGLGALLLLTRWIGERG
jgi:ubiquinol-cytochrome c reductase cytochrome c subunit